MHKLHVCISFIIFVSLNIKFTNNLESSSINQAFVLFINLFSIIPVAAMTRNDWAYKEYHNKVSDESDSPLLVKFPSCHVHFSHNVILQQWLRWSCSLQKSALTVLSKLFSLNNNYEWIIRALLFYWPVGDSKHFQLNILKIEVVKIMSPQVISVFRPHLSNELAIEPYVKNSLSRSCVNSAPDWEIHLILLWRNYIMM